ncbi:hypothetical protein FIBSPDRAFT_58596 [Athelia psychrophila]|uniref:Uncharacterized protein n=1 Tax=Athelia psychrophila TaxID=1759441 RepID=A0A166F8Q6_9AGAM|nr:hypothetical protein FIBSPDRAFT_58596 [Fibularhizoctonia sp. CBS 109695]
MPLHPRLNCHSTAPRPSGKRQAAGKISAATKRSPSIIGITTLWTCRGQLLITARPLLPLIL